MPNRLAGETSPYLLQHKDNPVDWFPWGPEALAKAKQEDRPIFLSIGYSACHWCHVMEHESFEDPQTAEVMNALFVSIKVDREERPDLDSIYMQAVQTLTGRGGWPMSVFLTPAGQPFYGGTYYPPDDRHGMPSFTKVLMAVADAYQNKRSDVTDTAGQLTSRLQPAAVQGTEMLTVDLLQQACQSAKAQFEPAHGGFGSAPKFPQPMTLEFLLRCWARFGDAEALRMATFTMQKMARGGMYDQVGGGFHRYSTDAFWLVPHFEKMLYDNALLSRVYVQAAQATGEPFYRRIAEETFDYVLKEMTHPSGAFYSTQDADSEGHEGKFFVWTPVQTAALLGEEDARVVNHYYGATEAGNFEGRNIFHVPSDASKAAADLGMPEQAVLAIVERARARLYAAREERVHPGLDDKVLTSWNGLMLRSLAEGAAALGRDDYLQAAVKNAAFLLSTMRRDGRLLRTYKDGTAKLTAYLEDYAMLAEGLVSLYEATFERRWLDEAVSLADAMASLYWDPGEGLFYDTASDHESLIVRPRDTFDNAMPSGGSAAAGVLLRLAVLTGESEYNRKAASTLRSVTQQASRYALGFGNWLGALDFYLSTPKEIAIIGPKDDPLTSDLRRTAFGGFVPNKVVAGWDGTDPGPAEGVPLLHERPLVNGRAAAYVCENYACRLPATDAHTLASQLELNR